MTRYLIRRRLDGRCLTVTHHDHLYFSTWLEGADLATTWPSMTEAMLIALALRLSGDYSVDPVKGESHV